MVRGKSQGVRLLRANSMIYRWPGRGMKAAKTTVAAKIFV